ncbi:unnamed protein product [Protopolystoma xenopodis]|uniref:Uncharacterized protein n=1 Tax=Protopolystoma xenopodis TaxID=117903 RepID=A0A3S5CSD2_9PLAT|nr:unnamed protein product [Protopolystoma xenopodis]
MRALQVSYSLRKGFLGRSASEDKHTPQRLCLSYRVSDGHRMHVILSGLLSDKIVGLVVMVATCRHSPVHGQPRDLADGRRRGLLHNVLLLKARPAWKVPDPT